MCAPTIAAPGIVLNVAIHHTKPLARAIAFVARIRPDRLEGQRIIVINAQPLMRPYRGQVRNIQVSSCKNSTKATTSGDCQRKLVSLSVSASLPRSSAQLVQVFVVKSFPSKLTRLKKSLSSCHRVLFSSSTSSPLGALQNFLLI